MDVLDFFELCSVGDWVSVKNVLENRLVDVNYQHKLNGWTALHWASRRGHRTVIELLLKYGADPTMTDTQGRSAADVAADQSIVMLLGGPHLKAVESDTSKPYTEELPIVPNYLRHPVFLHAKKSNTTFQASDPRTATYDADRSTSGLKVPSVLIYSGICAIGVVALAFLIRR